MVNTAVPGTERLGGVSIIVPAYNEVKTVGGVLTGIKDAMNTADFEYEIIAIDDASKDKTADAIRAVRDVLLITKEANEGYGAALKTGIRFARYENIVIIDADGTYPASKMPEMLKHMHDYDMVVAARIGSQTYVPPLRNAVKTVLSAFARYLSGKNIPDLNSGFRVMKKEAVSVFLNILPSGFSFTTTITLAFLTNDYRVKYIPIDYKHRNRKSKFHPIKDTTGMFTLIIRSTLYFNPLKIFAPLGFMLILSGTAVFVWSWLFLPKILDVTTALFVIAGIQTFVIGLLADLIDKRTR